MSYSRGDVVWAKAPFGSSSDRPWLIASNQSHPFDDEEVICFMITTTPRDEALEIEDSDILRGGFPRQSYLNPWVPATIKRSSLNQFQAELDQDVVNQASKMLFGYLV